MSDLSSQLLLDVLSLHHRLSITCRGNMETENSTNETRETVPEFEGVNLLGADRRVDDISPYALPTQDDGSEIRHRCPNALIDWGRRHLTLRERAMIALMSELTDKPE